MKKKKELFVVEILEKIERLLDIDREKVFKEIQEVFCIHCGAKHPSHQGRKCQCWNDG